VHTDYLKTSAIALSRERDFRLRNRLSAGFGEETLGTGNGKGGKDEAGKGLRFVITRHTTDYLLGFVCLGG